MSSFVIDIALVLAVIMINYGVIEAEPNSQQFARKVVEPLSLDTYYRYDEINDYLQDLVSNHPTQAMIRTIGKSSEGRDLNIIHITSDPMANRPGILVVAGVHAAEWITPALSLYIANQLLENKTNSDMLSSVDWCIMPLLNPDGYEYSYKQDRHWVKTRSNSSNSQCIGVNIERNFGFHWNDIGTKDDPCSNDYAGTKPFSEPESKALSDFALIFRNKIKLYLELQCYGNDIVYPWSYTTDPPANKKVFDDLAQSVNEALVAAGDYRYNVGSYADVLTVTSGTAQDWMHGVAGVPLSFTVRITNSLYRHVIRASLIKPTVIKFFPAMRVFSSYVRDHY